MFRYHWIKKNIQFLVDSLIRTPLATGLLLTFTLDSVNPVRSAAWEIRGLLAVDIPFWKKSSKIFFCSSLLYWNGTILLNYSIFLAVLPFIKSRNYLFPLWISRLWSELHNFFFFHSFRALALDFWYFFFISYSLKINKPTTRTSTLTVSWLLELLGVTCWLAISINSQNTGSQNIVWLCNCKKYVWPLQGVTANWTDINMCGMVYGHSNCLF